MHKFKNILAILSIISISFLNANAAGTEEFQFKTVVEKDGTVLLPVEKNDFGPVLYEPGKLKDPSVVDFNEANGEWSFINDRITGFTG